MYAPQCDCVAVHGGAVINRESHRLGVIAHTGKYVLDNTWDATGWVNVNPADPNEFHPPPRAEHSAVLYTKGEGVEYAIFYGGVGNSLGWVRGDVVVLDVNGARWHTAEQRGRNSTAHSALLRGTDMYVFGGWNGGDVFYTDICIFDVVHELWSYPQSPGIAPSPRRFASFTLVTVDETVHDYALLFGGFALHDGVMMTPERGGAIEPGQWQYDADKHYAEGLWRLDFSTLTWTLLVEDVSGNGVVPPRLFWPVTLFYANADAKSHELIVYGGAVDGEHSRAVTDVWRLVLNHCPVGMTGTDCQTVIDCTGIGGCAVGAGVCVGHNACRCKSGFGGETCDTFNCDYLFDCSGGGNCTSANVCTCDAEHEGEACQFRRGARTASRLPPVDSSTTTIAVWAAQSTASGPWVALSAVILGLVVIVYGACAAIKNSWAPLSVVAMPRNDRYSKNLEL